MYANQTPVQTVREQIAGHLRADILSGTLERGTPVREQPLAERFGVSRAPIRDVLRQLTQEGLLVAEPNCGVRVSVEPSKWMQPLIVNLRREIEVAALRKSIRKLTSDDLARLGEIVERLREACEAGDLTSVVEQDIAFHQSLLDLAGEDDLVAIWIPIVMRMVMHYSRHEEMTQSYDEHIAILDALRDRDLREAIIALEMNIQ